ncbi:hypothetical protein [Marmoricola sp. RAF53]|uniref:hypothetical protein n=1 Tax=Marmoricola sp. RAF53 TaxID=3233059 RepID=UPI003F9A3A6A
MRLHVPATALCGLLLAATLTACGGNDQPAVCGDVNDLKDSIAGLKDIKVGSGSALDDLESALNNIRGDLTTVKKEANSQFATQIDGVESALNALRAGVTDAVKDPSAAAVAAVGTTLSTFVTAVQTLVDDVQATC